MTQAALEAFAPAKINLFLHVLNRQSSGLHALDSLLVFAGIGDRLRLEPGPEPRLDLEGPFAGQLEAGEDNLVLRAARLVAAALPGAVTGHFHLEKALPVAAGIGGGSSDAAAALRLLMTCNSALDIARVAEIAAQLGSDVPACLAARPVWIEGTGAAVSDADDVAALEAVLVNPGVAAPTGKVFSQWDAANAGREQEAVARPGSLGDTRSLLRFLARTRNDLEAAACSLAPEISDALDAVAETEGCTLARMSGSGATVFGLYENAAEAKQAAGKLEAARPGWWVAATRLNARVEYRSLQPQAAPTGARSYP